MYKAALYIRLSEADDRLQDGETSESVQNQKALLFQYALEHHFDVYQIYVDEDWSGTDRNRPAFRRMIRDAEARRFDVILVKNQSRFTRDIGESEFYLHRKFPEWGIRLIAILDGTDTADPASQKTRQLNGLVNEWYLEDLSANVQAALAVKRQQGKYLASFALYGYRKDPADHNHLVPNPETAPVVQRIFALALAGLGAARIALILNAEGILTPSAYKHAQDARYKAPLQPQWSDTAIYKILHNPIYTGAMVQGRFKKATYKKSTMIRQPPEKWVVVPDTHEALVTQADFARIQQILRQRQTKSAPVPVWRPLARKVKCGSCGGGLMTTGGQSTLQMRCLHNRRDPRRCSPNRIPLEELEAVVLDKLKLHLHELLDLDQLANRTWQGNSRYAKRRQELREAEREKERISKQMQTLYLQRTEGELDFALFSARAAALQRQKQSLETRMEQLARQTALPPLEEIKQKLLPFLQADQLTREMSDALIDHVTVWPVRANTGISSPRKIEIMWKF